MSDGEFTKTCMKCETEYSIMEDHKCEPKHTAEPWFIYNHPLHPMVIKNFGPEFTICCFKKELSESERESNAQRIVDCVNALAGIEDVVAWKEKARIALISAGVAEVVYGELFPKTPEGKQVD